MNRPRALFVCGQLPSREAAQAGHKTAYKFLTDLSRTHMVDLLISCNAGDLLGQSVTLHELGTLAHSVRCVRVSKLGRLLAIASGLFQGVAPRFAPRRSLRLAREFRSLIEERSPDLVWLEFSQAFWLIDHVPEGVRTVLSAHDIQTQLVASKSGVELSSMLGVTYRSERRFLDRADKVRVQSTKDGALLELFFRLPSQKIEVVKPALSTFLDRLKRNSEVLEPFSILFWGAMGRLENADAAVAFARRDFVALRSQYPAAKLYIVGSNPTAEVRALASASVTVTGFLDDPSRYFESCSLGIAPLVSGAGVKVKVLEMLEAGMPVISTPVGAEGIESNPLLTVADRREFVEAIRRAWQ